MKRFRSLFVIFLVLLVFVGGSGCIGGGKVTETIKEQASSAIESYTEGQSSSYTESPTQSYTETQSQTETETGDYASWINPWDAYKPVNIGGERYLITYVKYSLRIRKEEGAPIYEYEVEKKRGKTRIHVYGMNINMETGEQEKVDLGEFDAYEYYGKVTPVNAEEMNSTLEFKVWVKQRSEDTDLFFLFPTLEFATIYYSMYAGSGNAIGVWVKYGNQEFAFYNPAAVGEMSATPYQEGDVDMLSNVPDIEDLYLGWYTLYYFGFWTALEEENIYKPSQGSWGIMGWQYNYEINPDGTVTLGGKRFRVSNVKWNYVFGGATGQGEATIAANLPIPIEAKGVFISQDSGTNIFMHIKVEDMGFEKV
ncbi:hypothetical protein [Palaeococcus ferrophilus]|uniref:hypothetical protein n=1 Tax=Palaeococcus ferrophilus TaxID=83868 RepID=UPI000696A10D|nr:hypothetical protein [Palaeococcus ferrophilus]